MNVKEVAVAGVWCASAIGVAGWTWQAYMQQYSKFPGPDDIPGASPFDWRSFVFGPLAPVEKAVQKAIGTALAPLPPRPKFAKGTHGAAPGVQPHPGR